ncbi:TRAP transporter permease [Sedimentibacter saalensis]|uniref:TRAP transporter permease n=1 Tax=Sedimentibacter saalensis TaxID=130788 RepID=UPI0028993225|nr:TRAP transporter fused permease subunit [Sedimentibacter saalensis]
MSKKENNNIDINMSELDTDIALQELAEKDKHTIKGKITGFIAILWASFHIYTGVFGLFDAITQRGIHLAFGITILLLQLPLVNKLGKGKFKENKIMSHILYIIDFLMIVGIWSAVFISRYEYNMRVARAGGVTIWAAIAGFTLLVVILECARRSLGNILPIIAIISIVYAIAGPYLPRALAHKGYTFERIFSFLSTNTDGIFGMTLSVSATVIFMFILFGSFLEASGCSSFINDFAISLTGKKKSGPALSAVIASALMGTINGSAVANVVGTGTFTIPLMKSRGYKPEFAGAVEAVASTGGQILPPVMGAGAFIMVSFTGISYAAIVKAAVIPALLYFLGCAFSITFRSSKAGIKPTPDDEIPDAKKVLKDGIIYLLIIGILIYGLMIANYSPLKAALIATIAVPFIMLIDKKKRFTYKQIPDALKMAGFNAVSVVMGCACAGVIVSMVAITGIGVVFGDMMISLAGGSIPFALLFTALACVILGMGLPTTASYVIAAAILAPALVKLGIPLLVAHLFVFYYACLSAITPPVALAAYAGAGIAKGDPMKTGIEAVKIGFAGFIVPFMFAFNSVLMMEGSILAVLWSTLTAIIGVLAMSAGFQGYYLIKNSKIESLVLTVAGLLGIIPEPITDIVGLVVIIGITLMQLKKKKKMEYASGVYKCI